ncbi:YdcF family protein [Caldovatus aquaticus]|uniref:YdcF family protein n=1 Tax=Caldovatus aquaticus TaxID=2865671 RepID=A0ABS7F3D8_9PROT|nr:YdcF family protein [Caldovatus aquaticus]MBW8270125.1 YdcF family protein [Caldovatus aquaticus]
MSLGAFGGGFAWFVNQTLRAPEPPPFRQTDAIAVLTGGRERVETGLRLLAAGHARRMVISGVHRDARLADLARAAGLDPAPLAGRITVGRAAATTRGNAAEIAAWVRAQPEGTVRSLRVVTAGYHMPRALLELRRALPGVELVPHPVTPPALRGVSAAARLRTWSLLLGEYAKFLLAGAGLSRFAVARDGGDGAAAGEARPGPRAGAPREAGGR